MLKSRQKNSTTNANLKAESIEFTEKENKAIYFHKLGEFPCEINIVVKNQDFKM